MALISADDIENLVRCSRLAAQTAHFLTEPHHPGWDAAVVKLKESKEVATEVITALAEDGDLMRNEIFFGITTTDRYWLLRRLINGFVASVKFKRSCEELNARRGVDELLTYGIKPVNARYKIAYRDDDTDEYSVGTHSSMLYALWAASLQINERHIEPMLNNIASTTSVVELADAVEAFIAYGRRRLIPIEFAYDETEYDRDDVDHRLGYEVAQARAIAVGSSFQYPPLPNKVEWLTGDQYRDCSNTNRAQAFSAAEIERVAAIERSSPGLDQRTIARKLRQQDEGGIRNQKLGRILQKLRGS